MDSSKNKLIEEQLQNSINKKEELTKERFQLASTIGFKDLKETLESVDQFGFINDDKK